MNAENNPILLQIAQYINDTFQWEVLNHKHGKYKGYVASGALLDSIKTTVEQTMQRVTITTNALYYAKYIKRGRRIEEKGVPLDVLIEWIRQRKLDLNGMKEKSVAYVIQRSIKAKGIKPSTFIAKSIAKIEKSKRLENNIDRVMRQYADSIFEEMFNKLAK